jgi:transposase-like protein
MDIQIVAPQGGKDYPRKWTEFLDWFPTEEACLAYLERLRWSNGFVCPKCGVAEPAYRASRGRLVCRSCGRQTTVTCGTIFDKTRTPLRVWLAAAWYLTNQKHGVSALGLQRVIGVGSYETAWAMLHRLRRAMVRPDREALSGHVEVDETYIGLTDRDPLPAAERKSRSTKALLAVAVEIIKPKGFGRIRLKRLRSSSEQHVVPFVQESVEVGSTVQSDGSPAYRKLAELGYRHERTVMLGAKAKAHELMPGVHRVASLVQRWMLGTHHGAVKPDQLDFYLDEFVFRFNRRTSRSRGLLFHRLLQQAVITAPVTYEDVTNKRVKRHRPRAPAGFAEAHSA